MTVNKNIIVTVVLFLAFIVVLISFDLPFYSKVASLRGEVKYAKNSIIEKEELLVKIDQLKQVYDSRKGAISKAFYLLPIEKGTSSLIVQFEALVSENGLILKSINFTEKIKKRTPTGGDEVAVVPGQIYKTLKVSVELYGSYASFKSFLEALEYNVRIMDINSISFSSEKDEESSVFNFNVELEVYYQ